MNFNKEFGLLVESGVFSSGHFKVLIYIILFDIVLGCLRAVLQKRLNSDIGIKGLIKHTTVIIISILLGSMLRLSNQSELAVMLEYFYIGEYGLSVLENLTVMGVPFPEWLKNLVDTTKKRGVNTNGVQSARQDKEY